jgi:hypothetical protein
MTGNPYAPPGSQVADVDPGPSAPGRPRAVKVAIGLLWLGLALGIPEMIYRMADPPPQIQGTMYRTMLVAGTLFIILMLSILAWIIMKTARGKNWARVVHLVLLVIGFALAFRTMPAAFAAGVHIGMTNVLQVAAKTAAVILLFLPASNAWYLAMKAR